MIFTSPLGRGLGEGYERQGGVLSPLLQKERVRVRFLTRITK
jgi:hypothetical protein